MKPRIIVVCGLGFGDEGKGTIVDFLAAKHGIKKVVRYNGGGQAGHNIVTPKGIWHCFSQFGAHSLLPDAETFLSREMLIDPHTLMVEAEALGAKGCQRVCSRVVIDSRATIVTPYHKMIGRMKEAARGLGRFGSCGMGIGEAIRSRADLGLVIGDIFSRNFSDKLKSLMVKEFAEADKLVKSHKDLSELRDIKDYFWEKYGDCTALTNTYRRFATQLGLTIDSRQSYLRDCFKNGEAIIFEGAQGALLDRDWGFQPHVTQSRTTYHNAYNLLTERMSAASYDFKKIGVFRAYGHRHGAGPFVTEGPPFGAVWVDPYNRENPWQGKFRIGVLDLVALRYGLMLNEGVDELALTSLDAYSGLKEIPICTSYEYRGDLAPLDSCAVWQKNGDNRALITALKKPANREAQKMTAILLRCRPRKVCLPAWPNDISAIRNFNSLPREAQSFVRFLEGSDGLCYPVKVISVGPRRDQKLFV